MSMIAVLLVVVVVGRLFEKRERERRRKRGKVVLETIAKTTMRRVSRSLGLPLLQQYRILLMREIHDCILPLRRQGREE